MRTAIITTIAALALSWGLQAAWSAEPRPGAADRLQALQQRHDELSQQIADAREDLHARIVEAGGLTPLLRREQEGVELLESQRDSLAGLVEVLQAKVDRQQPAQGAASGAQAGAEAGSVARGSQGTGAVAGAVAGRDLAPLAALMAQAQEFDGEARKWRQRALDARRQAQVYAARVTWIWLRSLDLSPVFAQPPAGMSDDGRREFADDLADLNRTLGRISDALEATADPDPQTARAQALNLLDRWDAYRRARPDAEVLPAAVLEALE